MALILGPILGAVSHDEARIGFVAEHPGDLLVHVFHEHGAELAGSPFRPAIRSTRPEHAAHPLLLQLTSSPLTSEPFARFVRRPPRYFQRVPIALGIEGEILDWLPERNFGVVELAEGRSEVALRLVDERGVTRVHRTLA